MKNIQIFKENLQVYENMDHSVEKLEKAAIILRAQLKKVKRTNESVFEKLNDRKIHCEGIDSEFIFLKIDLENLNE